MKNNWFMDRNQFAQFLTKGLLHGYVSSGVKPHERGSFKGKESVVTLGHAKYHDEWFGHYSGGGQELVSIGNQQFTRLYGGGTPGKEILDAMGITHDDVGSYLKKKIIELKDQTRLFENCTPQADGDWQYSYTILEDHADISITTAKELIAYKGSDVHIHVFILCPVK